MNDHTNPPGKWRKLDENYFQFSNRAIGAVYGLVGRKSLEDLWYWEARTLLDTRVDGKPVCGYVLTLESAKTIVETVLRETRTCDFPKQEDQGNDVLLK